MTEIEKLIEKLRSTGDADDAIFAAVFEDIAARLDRLEIASRINRNFGAIAFNEKLGIVVESPPAEAGTQPEGKT
jgi:hypothetical protein